MRVIRRATTGQRPAERGVAAVLVAITLSALCAVGALALDLGNAWQTRRNLVTAADAGALAAAQDYAVGQPGCPTTGADYVTRNAPGATTTRCEATVNGGSGSVLVEAEQEAGYVLAGVFGVDSQPVRAATIVRWGAPASITGLRPFGMCIEGEHDFIDWLADPTTVEVITITYGKDDNAAACNGGDAVPGNWGIIDFNGGSNSEAEVKDWILNGYPGHVTAGTYAGDCTTEPYACYEGSTGAFSNSINSALQSLVDSGEQFVLPLFDKASGTGANALFHLVGFVNARLVEFKTTGHQDTRSLTLEFQPGIVQGTCCDPTAIDTGLRVVEICAIDPNDTSGC
jgi:hypothetical protein